MDGLVAGAETVGLAVRVDQVAAGLLVGPPQAVNDIQVTSAAPRRVARLRREDLSVRWARLRGRGKTDMQRVYHHTYE
ncbi:hypothetical protein GCM10009835_49600 [Planosporangium flavigriseum]|uniref:Uncharacterized protein n=1 Tax=Planosporangium flavigriseum TaxID=373681 RepID=A0A8J3LZ74_9ACTN|nr:hypothetical protein Pfl04_44790 [Planosporangium flavigriseum]